MKTKLKSFRTVVLVILALIIVVVIIIDQFADLALKMGIEAAATKTLNVGVSVGDVGLSIIGGKLEIEKLSINNPPGYTHEKLLELEKGNIEIEVKSLLSDTVKIKEIKLDGINLTLEQRGISSNNVQDIINSISAGTKEEKPAEEPKAAEAGGKKLYIENLEITNVTVKAKLLPVPGKADTVTLKLEPIRMQNLGSDNKLDTAKLTSKVLLAIADGVAKQGAGVLPDSMVGTMKSTLDKTMQLGKTATEEGKKVLESGKDIGQGVTEGIKGLFKKKED